MRPAVATRAQASSGTDYTAVYKAVAVACMGALLFGFHLGIVNGPLMQIATDLGFADNVGLQGLVRSHCSAS